MEIQQKLLVNVDLEWIFFIDFVEIEWTLVMNVDFNEFLMDFISGL
jgi:hypothetical protein